MAYADAASACQSERTLANSRGTHEPFTITLTFTCRANHKWIFRWNFLLHFVLCLLSAPRTSCTSTRPHAKNCAKITCISKRRHAPAPTPTDISIISLLEYFFLLPPFPLGLQHTIKLKMNCKRRQICTNKMQKEAGKKLWHKRKCRAKKRKNIAKHFPINLHKLHCRKRRPCPPSSPSSPSSLPAASISILCLAFFALLSPLSAQLFFLLILPRCILVGAPGNLAHGIVSRMRTLSWHKALSIVFCLTISCSCCCCCHC